MTIRRPVNRAPVEVLAQSGWLAKNPDDYPIRPRRSSCLQRKRTLSSELPEPGTGPQGTGL